MMRKALLTVAACALALSASVLVAFAQAQPAHLEKALQTERQKADERKGAVQKLAEREKALAGKLGEIEKRMQAAEQRIGKQEEALAVIRKEEARFAEQYEAVRLKREQSVRELRKLLELLWPINAQGMHEGARLADSWDTADRRFQWNSAAYNRARAKLEEVRAQERELAGVIARQKELEAQVDKQLTAINADKDTLLKDRLAVNARMSQVTTQRRDLESELQSIIKTIQQLNYQLVIQRSRKFDAFKASLPWPVAGKIVATFAPDGKPARRGIGIATSDGATVRSVFWGKVVHNDVLRGLGKVVILYHGGDYYSLYAYLSDVTVEAGQDVEKDEPLGHAGYYPEAHGNGLYFELRFHQKPINPQLWLMPAH
ncbi:MAG: peptidoglycan DD-metalloendopeptidase family protein [Desulfovibrio sp.]|jgi:septal ring factor EnvC (AmiA/AmiB activator)|nr:peptidoglycan DD-metalloendopeptidase family protein [Desulfovibrio sp.]